MPLNFHGRWNLKLQDCSRFSDAKEIRVFGNMIELVGYKGSINKVIILNSNTVDVQYTISDGSGEFHDSETYILRDGGRALQVGTVDDAPVFYKCPLITENGISNAQNQ